MMAFLSPKQRRGTTIFLACLYVLLSVGQSANTTSIAYAPAPAINLTKLVQLNNSAQGSIFIGSKRLESLQISQNGSTTSFILTFFNRSSSNNINQYAIANEPGTWIYLKGTKETLSCNLIYDTTASVFGLLQFINDQGIFKILAKMSLDNLQAYLPPSSSTLNYSEIANFFTPGEQCQVGMFFNSVYYLQNATGLVNITLPSGWKIQAYTQSFKYGVTDHSLYKLNNTSFQYDKVYTFETFLTYSLKESQGRMIIIGANGTSYNNGTPNSFIQKIHILQDKLSGLNLVSIVIVNGTSFAQSIIPVFTSPQLTKFLYSYVPAGTSGLSKMFPKSVDYINNKVIDMFFTDSTHANLTFNGALATEFDFSDYFLVMRNASKLIKNSTLRAAEEVYQFMGNKIVYYGYRGLNSSFEINDSELVLVDLYYTYTLVVLDVYRTANGRVIYQVEYGSYADTRKLVPPIILPYIKFVEPASSFKQSLNRKNFTWGFYSSYQNITNITIIRINPSTLDTHIDTFNRSVTGNFQSVIQSTYCRILLEKTTQQYYLYGYDSSQTNITSYSLTAVLDGMNINGSDQWYVSDKCDKFSVQNKIFFLNNNSYRLVNNDYSTFSWSSIDISMKYTITNGNIWKYDQYLNKFVQYTYNASILSFSSISTYQNTILITATNSTDTISAIDTQIHGFIYENSTSTLNLIFNYRAVFSTSPTFEYSERLTKVAVIGTKGSRVIVDAYYINYAQKTNISLIFPIQTISQLSFTKIGMFESYIYIRQLYDFSKSNNHTYNSISQQEFVYYLKQGYLPQLLLRRNLTTDQALQWKKSLVYSENGISYNLAVESLEAISSVNYVIVRFTQLIPQLVSLNSGSSTLVISGYVLNGAVALCTPGCSDCSTQICTSCKNGFAFDSNAALCISCAPGCQTCLVTNPLICTSCFSGTYLSRSNCIPCNTNCITCSGSANSCISCHPGQFYSSDVTQCRMCPRNCRTCSDALTCIECNEGFVVTPSNTCRGCSFSCSDCNPINITQCTSCASGLQLINAQCIQCPPYCLICNNGKCQGCIPGYSPNTAGACVLNCQLPCATCTDNQPTVCTSCYKSAMLGNGTCLISPSCNTTGICADCGQVLGYFLLNQYCYPCSLINSISNCLQCSQANQQICSICKDGYYLDSTGACPACSAPCATCIGSNICTSCQKGYTISIDQSQGQCLQCVSPCDTCYGLATYCTSCVGGFIKKGWKCQSNNSISFTVTLTSAGISQSSVLAAIDAVIISLLALLGQNQSFIDVITIQSVRSGSVILVASATPSSSNITTAAANLQTALSNNGTIIGGFSVASTSVVTNQPNSSNTSSNSLIILIIIISSFVFIVLLSIIIACFCKKSDQSRPAGAFSRRIAPENSFNISNSNQTDSSNFKVARRLRRFDIYHSKSSDIIDLQ